jgi:hypothetical protein
MPSSVRSVFAAAGLEAGGSVSRGAPVPTNPAGPTTGIYVIARTSEAEDLSRARTLCPISDDALRELLDARPELLLDGQRPDVDALRRRLAEFWLPDEVIVYIGLAGPRRTTPKEGELAKRVNEYLKTPLGARTPHAGGWFLKTLSILDQLVLHYAYSDDVHSAERAMLRAFASSVSSSSRAGLHDGERLMPFANLEYPPGVRKRHGITGAKETRRASRNAPPATPTAAATGFGGHISTGGLRSDAARHPGRSEGGNRPIFPSDEASFSSVEDRLAG